jgi:uncharacterized membrane protein YkoI
MRVRLLLIPLLLALGLAHGADHEAVRQAVQAGKLKPLAEILQSVQTVHPGRVLDVDLESDDLSGRRWYEIKLLNKNGQRVGVYVDAVSGAEIRQPQAVGAGVKPIAGLLRQLLAQHPGVVQQFELELTPERRQVYEIAILAADGREHRLVVDAISGKALDTHPLQKPWPAGMKPLSELIERLEKRYGGRATESELKRDRQGRAYYEVELELGNGRGLEINVDALSGRVIGEDELR